MAKKIHQTLKNIGLRSSAYALASCLILSGIPLAAQAAGLGKIVVLSSLGQPLRAEIDVLATRDEFSGMKAQLAPPDAFKQAGLDYATTLLSIRFKLDKRADGQPVLRLTSDRPINDPFVDMLLELNWPAGRLVREYTFLLDPPEVAAKGFPPLAPAMAKPATASKQTVATTRTKSAIDDELRSKAVARIRNPGSAQKSAAQPSSSGPDTLEVKRGDTLHKIAGESKPDGVSLDQMLVGLFRANQDAFDGGNMNRLRAGKILVVPEKSTVEAVSSGEASKIVRAQASDWNAYRNKLAGVAAQAPVSDEAARQEATGKISAKVEDKAAPSVEPKDQLKVSRTETTAAKPDVGAKRSEEDLIAKEKALKEANERLIALEKNVSDLQKLVELKNQNLAELQAQASSKAMPLESIKPTEETKPPATTPDPVPVAPPAKIEPVATAIEKPAEKPAETTPPEPAPKPEEPKPEPKPAVKPKPAIAPPPPLEEPGFIDGLLDNPLALAGGGGVLALLAAYFVSRRRRAGKEEVPLDSSSTLSPQSSSLSLTANSVFRNTGGQSVDTSHTPAQTDFSQAGPGSIDTDEVDPVAEADVYMAYGRDVQAEEILVEAKQKDPKRHAIHLKLLEIYSNRKDLKQFETLATDLYGDTGGVGADWEKAAAMGLKLDPANPLFGSASAPAADAPFDPDATVLVSPQAMKNTVTLPGELSQMAEEASAKTAGEPAPASVSTAAADATSLDFDLGLGDDKPSAASGEVKAELEETHRLPEPVIDSSALDFDLAADTGTPDSATDADATVVGLDFDLPDAAKAEASDDGTVATAPDLDFDLGFEPSPAETAEPKTDSPDSSNAAASAVSSDDVDFDISMTESTFLGRPMPEPSSFDMSSIDLDLKEPEAEASASTPPPSVAKPDSSSDLPDSSFDDVQVSTSVNPDFETEQSATIVNPQFGTDQDDLMPEQDFSSEQMATAVNPQFDGEQTLVAGRDFSATQEDTVVNPQFDGEQTLVSGRDFSATQSETVVNPQFGDDQDLAPEFEISPNEEVTTKLDLAKAYEEMGDLEGARELLQEVLKEGDAAQQEKAQAILAKISE